MNKILRAVAACVALALSGGCGAALGANDSAQQVGWRGGPRIGLSAATGIFGVEVQYGHVAVAAGVIPICIFECETIVTTSVRYYVADTGSSWFAEIFSWSLDDGSGDGLLGADAGYRWRFGSGWDLAAAFGIARGRGEFEGSSPLPSVSFGYSF